MLRAVREDSCSASTRRVVQSMIIALAPSLNLRSIYFFFSPALSREYFHLKKQRHSFAFVKRRGGASPFVLLQLGGLGTGLSPHFTRGGAGTRPGQPPLPLPFPGFLACPCGGGLHGPVSPCSFLPSLPPPVCT